MDKSIFINQEKEQPWSSKSIMIYGFFVLFLLTDFVAALGSIESHTTRYVYLSGVNILLIGYLFYDNNYKNPIDFKNVVLPFILYLCFIVLSGFSFFGSTNLSDSIIHFSYLIIAFTSTISFCILIKEHKYMIRHLIFLIILIVTFQSLETFFALLRLVTNFEEKTFVKLLKVNFGNINVRSASLSLKIPFLLCGFFFYDNWKKYLSLIGYFTSVLLVILISARAAFLSVFFVHLAFFALYFLFFKDNKKNKLKKTSIVFLLTCLAVGSANLYFKNVQNDARFTSVQNRISQITTDDTNAGGSAAIRLKFWQNGLQLINEHPIFGIGIGNWKLAGLPLEKHLTDKSNVSIHPHNDFVEITAETGILNGLIFVSVFISVFIIAFRNLQNDPELLPRIANLLSILLLISYLIDSFFNFPLYIPTSQLYWVLIFVLLFIGAQNSQKSYSLKLKLLVLLLTISSIATTYVSYKVYESYVAVRNIKKSKLHNLAIKLSDLSKLSEEATFVNNYETTTFQEYFAQYYVNQKEYDKAIIHIKKISTVNPYLGHDDWQMWKICFTKKQYDSAYYYINKAMDKRPRNNLFFKAKLDVLNVQKKTQEIVTSFYALKQYGAEDKEDYFHTIRILKEQNYDSKEIAKILDEGMKKFPKDSILINFKKAAPTPRELAVAHLKLAGVAFAANKNEEALKHYLVGLKIDPENIVVVQNIGIIYAKLKKEKKAIPYLLQALNSGKFNDGKTEYVLGVCYLELSNTEKACEYMKMAAAKNFSNAAIFIKESCTKTNKST